MKTLEEYLRLPYSLEILPDPDGTGYTARFPELPGCITVGCSLEETVSNAMDAKEEWICAALEDGSPVPEPNKRDGYSGQFKLRIPKSLHRSLAERARAEGISMNQYCLYLLTKNDTLEHAR